MSETPRPSKLQETWEVFLEVVRDSYLAARGITPLPSSEDHAHPGVRAMLRARRCAWMHARHVRGFSMFESIRLSQRLAEAFAEWTRSRAFPGEDELTRTLRRTEAQARQPASLETHAAFVEAFARLSGRDGYGSLMDTALDAFLALDRPRKDRGARV
ncbi:MAG TPA: hypothetical protein VFQ76_05245 [Longimicrobiaceae bacterium]|nr:hypothetical protein [Longimicrobiaceae bacterium]